MLAHGKSPARHKQAEKYAMAHTTTVFEFGERYFNEIVQRDCKDPRPIRRYLDKEIYPRLADKAVRDSVTPAEVQAIVFRKRDGGAPSSAAQIRNLLKRMFEYAMANGVITLNPRPHHPYALHHPGPPSDKEDPSPPANSGSISKPSTNRISGGIQAGASSRPASPWCANRSRS